MESNKSAPASDVPLQGRLLILSVQNLVVGIIKDDRPVFLQVLVGKVRRIVRNFDRETIVRPEFLNRFRARGNVVMDIEVGANLVPRINQHSRRRAGGSGDLAKARPRPYCILPTSAWRRRLWTTWRTISATRGERSNMPRRGITRRIGEMIGSVTSG